MGSVLKRVAAAVVLLLTLSCRSVIPLAPEGGSGVLLGPEFKVEDAAIVHSLLFSAGGTYELFHMDHPLNPRGPQEGTYEIRGEVAYLTPNWSEAKRQEFTIERDGGGVLVLQPSPKNYPLYGKPFKSDERLVGK